MAVTIVSRPEVDIEGNFISRWVSAEHPIVFKLQGEAYDPENKPNYGIIVQVLEYGTETLLGKSKLIRPYLSQPVEFNAAGFLKEYLKPYMTSPMKKGEVNKRDEGKVIHFYLKYKDQWEGYEGSYVSDTNTYYAAAIKSQIGDKYGSNLAQYLPVYGNVQQKNKAKFLTSFKKPVVFRGYPTTLSFIYPVDFNNVDMQFVEQRETADGDMYAPIYRALDKTQIDGVNRLQLSGNYPSDVKKIGLKVRSGQTADTNYYQPGYINSGFID